jgi:hypothetical protein
VFRYVDGELVLAADNGFQFLYAQYSVDVLILEAQAEAKQGCTGREDSLTVAIAALYLHPARTCKSAFRFRENGSFRRSTCKSAFRFAHFGQFGAVWQNVPALLQADRWISPK